MEICFDYYDEVTSTNDLAKKQIDVGAREGLVVLAWSQTQGRGRLGRTFFSPKGGIYLSMVLNQDENVLSITAKSAVALKRAIKSSTDKDVGIKWVNDIIYNNKKVAGILAEAYRDKVILGVGINFSVPQYEFPDELKGKACSLYNAPDKCDTDPFDLINAFVRNMEELCESGTDAFIEEYCKDNIVIGKKVEIIQADRKVGEGTAVSIDNDCFLHVIEKNGNEMILSSGEVTLKF